MSHNVHVAVYDTLADWEIGYATAHLNSGVWSRDPDRFRVVTVGETLAPVTTMGGLVISPDLAVTDLDPAESAMLILPGADSWLVGGNGTFVAAARAFLDAGVPVAAICGATAGLAAAGLLDDRDHTSNAREFLEATGYRGAERFRYEGAVTDGNVITASATAPVEFALAIFARLGLYEPAVLASWHKLYGQGDPAGYFELMAVVRGMTGAPELLGEMALTVFRLNGQLLGLAEELTRPVGLTAARWQVLGAVLRTPLTVAGIARAIGLTRQSVQRTADLLVDAGLAEYTPNPAHRRAKLFRPTDAGLAAVRRIGPGQAVAAERLAGAVGLDDLTGALDTMRRLGDALDSLSGDGPPR